MKNPQILTLHLRKLSVVSTAGAKCTASILVAYGPQPKMNIQAPLTSAPPTAGSFPHYINLPALQKTELNKQTFHLNGVFKGQSCGSPWPCPQFTFCSQRTLGSNVKQMACHSPIITVYTSCC